MKKHIVRIMATVLLTLAFAGLFTACASENAVTMQTMIDEMVTKNEGTDSTGKPYEAFMVEATKLDPQIKAIEDFYNGLTEEQQREPGMGRAKRNLENFKKKVADYRPVALLIMDVNFIDIMYGKDAYNNPTPIPSQYKEEVYNLIDKFNKLSNTQKQYEPERLSAAYDLLTKWKDQFEKEAA